MGSINGRLGEREAAAGPLRPLPQDGDVGICGRNFRTQTARYGPCKFADSAPSAPSSQNTKKRARFAGAPGRTRTCDPLLRRQPLYPPELPELKPKLAPRRASAALAVRVD